MLILLKILLLKLKHIQARENDYAYVPAHASKYSPRRESAAADDSLPHPSISATWQPSRYRLGSPDEGQAYRISADSGWTEGQVPRDARLQRETQVPCACQSTQSNTRNHPRHADLSGRSLSGASEDAWLPRAGRPLVFLLHQKTSRILEV